MPGIVTNTRTGEREMVDRIACQHVWDHAGVRDWVVCLACGAHEPNRGQLNAANADRRRAYIADTMRLWRERNLYTQ